MRHAERGIIDSSRAGIEPARIGWQAPCRAGLPPSLPSWRHSDRQALPAQFRPMRPTPRRIPTGREKAGDRPYDSRSCFIHKENRDRLSNLSSYHYYGGEGYGRLIRWSAHLNRSIQRSYRDRIRHSTLKHASSTPSRFHRGLGGKENLRVRRNRKMHVQIHQYLHTSTGASGISF
jgi:hypothetical protein